MRKAGLALAVLAGPAVLVSACGEERSQSSTTPRSAETINYEVTIEDPKVFSRPWKMSMPLYKRVERNAQILEFRCVEFVEDLLYGHLRKQPAK